jgi:iron complex outermembrane receptor protein
MKKLHLFLIFGLCLWSLCVHAQESTSRQIYNQAESEYEIGRIDQAIQLLQSNLENFDGLLEQSAYRLLSLCYLHEDKEDEARFYAERLVKLNNYYNSADDPARFQDLITQLKEGITTTITTASSQSETINEAPAPITIITAEMIEELGYNKHLGQILAAYVPGITEIGALVAGENLSMHSAFSNDQEHILIMENGHRLNNRFNNSGVINYAVSTEKIDHIEVLRGPASSLYGNVALSAVVNIITKSGKTVDGVKAKYGYASYNTHKADVTMGTQFMDADIFAWASIYKSDGQKRHFSDGEAYLQKFHSIKEEYAFYKSTYFDPDIIYVDGYKDTPAYDVGLSFKFRGFDLYFSKKNFKKILQCTNSRGGYSYERYRPIFGIKPGYGTESTHAEIGYTKQFKKINLNASLYSDWYRLTNYEPEIDSVIYLSPARDEETGIAIDEDGNIIFEEHISKGSFFTNHYRENTMGGYFKASTSYNLGNMKGNVLAGGQYEHYSLQSVMSLRGEEGKTIESGLLDYDEIVSAGKESSLSFFIQDKHYLLQKLILNAGIRYDLKYRQKEDVVKTFSPRLALMYVPNDRFSLKLTYSEAYADLSFFYRYITKTDFSSTDPQHLSAVQLTAMGKIPPAHINYEVNLFYNKYDNLLFWLERDWDYDLNSGRLTNAGIEGTASYAYKRLSASFSLYYCHDISSDGFYYNSSEKIVCNVPHFTFNLHGSFLILNGNDHDLKIYGHAAHTGKKLNYSESKDLDFYVDGKWLFDLGIQYRYKQRLQLSLDCENIFNTDHYICGPNPQYAPKFQRGRTLMASLSYQF